MSERFPKIHTIGLLGKMGAGKTTVLRWFEKKGIPTLNADTLVHELYEPGAMGQQKIQTFFRGDYLYKSGRVNRKKLLRTLGKSPKKWEVLNRIVLPLVAHEIQRRLQKLSGGVVVIEIQNPELRTIEPYIDEYWIVEAKEDLRKKRLSGRDTTTKDLAHLEAQQKGWVFPNGTHIPNHGTTAELEKFLENLWKERQKSL